jgi:serine/threonine protein kinase
MGCCAWSNARCTAVTLTSSSSGRRPSARLPIRRPCLRQPRSSTQTPSRHPCCRHIIGFHGVGLRTPGELRSAFYLMDLLPGGSVKGRYHPQTTSAPRRAAFSVSDAMRWSCELTSAVAHMHAGPAPVVHRDLKLDNVLLSARECARASAALADFGLAVQLEHRRAHAHDAALARLNAALQTRAPPLSRLHRIACMPACIVADASWPHEPLCMQRGVTCTSARA